MTVSTLKKISGLKDLPDVGLRAIGRNVLLLVEPRETTTKSGLHLLDGPIDRMGEPGYAWVLSAAEFYYAQNSEKWKPNPKPEDYSVKTKADVKRGDRVLFRRFYRSDNIGQGLDRRQKQLQIEFPGYELVFLHVQHLIGIIED